MQEVTTEELDAILQTRTLLVPSIGGTHLHYPEYLAHNLGDDELCELATEQEGGPLATIKGLIEGLLIKHKDDTATKATLHAIMVYHLPDLIEETAGVAK
jgi:hypothetical protein